MILGTPCNRLVKIQGGGRHPKKAKKFFSYIFYFKINANKKHSENADTSTSSTQFVCVCVCVCVWVCLSVIIIPAERMPIFGRGFHRIFACCTGSEPIEMGDLGFKVKVTVTENVSKNDEEIAKNSIINIFENKTYSLIKHFIDGIMNIL